MSESIHSVLVVDDNRMNRLKMTRALDRGDFLISEASGGQEALDLLQSQVFHLVLLDLLMPEVDGFQVLERMQSDQQLARIPVIMVSAVEENEAVERCLKIGAVDYITKPVGAETLNDRVRRALHLS